MAQTFNLTAQINLRGPANIKPIVANIKKQLGGINTNVNIKLDAKAARNIDVINNKLKALNATLIQASRNSQNLASSLSSIGAAAQNLSSLNKVNSNLSKITNNVNSSGKALKQASSEMENFGKQSALAIKRFAAFSVVTVGVYGLVNAISQGARAFLEFDKQLIRLQQVTKTGAVGIRELEKEIRRLAVGLGVSSESLTQVAVTLAQAGLSATETKQALEALAKTELAPSFDNITDTTEGAIAAMRQFGISANELEAALGSINAVAAAFAVESGDIIAAIQRTGGVFAAASKGVSEGTDALNEFIAVFTSVRATTRESAETIATGLRTIFTRIQRGSTIDFLREFGIELTDIEGKFVGPYEAVKRLSEGLKLLDPRDLRFSKIVEELGGFRQISKVIPLLQQFGDAQKALSVAQGGTGSLAAAQAKAQLSLANQIARVREEFLELVAAFSKSETLQSVFTIVIGLTRGLIKLTSAFKPILPLLAVLGAVKGAGAIAKFGKGFFGSFKKGGGASAAGSTLGQTITGSSSSSSSTTSSPLDAAALNAMTQAVTANSGALNSSTTALNNLITPLQTLTTSISGVGASLTTSISPLFQFIFDLDYSIRSLDSSVQALTVKIDNIGGGGTTLNDGGKVLGFARGGVVPGTGNRDTVPAMLQPGEFVIRKKAVETIGAENLHSMNKYGSGGSVISGMGGQRRQKFAKGGPVSLESLSKVRGGKSIPFNSTIQPVDEVFADIERVNITDKEIKDFYSKTKKSSSFAEDLNVGAEFYGYGEATPQSRGLAFEDFILAYVNSKNKRYEKTVNRFNDETHPVDLVSQSDPPIEVRFRNERTENDVLLAKKLRYNLLSNINMPFTANSDINDKAIDLDKISLYEVDPKYKKSLGFKFGGKIQKFLDGGWVKRMQQQKKSSLVNAATQLEYWIDKIYAGTEEVGYSPSFKGVKNPSEKIDFKELQERLAAIDEVLNTPVSPAKAKKSGLKADGGYEPEELLDAVKLYQGGSGPLTRAMANQDFIFIDRKEQYDTEDVVARLQAASQYQTRKKLYSGLGKSQFYETLKDTGLSEDDISDTSKVKSIVGKTIDFPTFLSTSYKKEVAEGFVGDPGAMMEISTAKAKTAGIDVNKAKMTSDSGKPTTRRLPGIDKIPKEKLFKYDDEDEFILPPNTAFKVKQASSNKIRAKSEDDEEWDIIMGTGGDKTPLMDIAVQMLMGGGIAKAQPAKKQFGTGTFPFPKRISNAYFREIDKVLEQEKIKLAWDTYPMEERILVDESSVRSNLDSPFDKSAFIKSFSEQIRRDALFGQIGQFAKFIGLPSEDLSAVLPRQIDFGIGLSAQGAYHSDPTKADRGLGSIDLGPYGFSEQDKQDLYGYEALAIEKEKETAKVLKTPVKTFDDGSFSYDSDKAQSLWQERRDLGSKISKLMGKRLDAQKLASQAISDEADRTGRGSVTINRTSRNRPNRGSILYHELTHQLFQGLKTKKADSFDKYKQRVNSLFENDNNGLVDAFDALGGGYNSADIVYGRAYKIRYLQLVLRNLLQDKKLPGKDELATSASLAINKGTAYKKAQEFKPINPEINDLLLQGNLSQQAIDKMEDNGKEEFLTTLVEKSPMLDANLQEVLNSTLSSLLADAGIQRQAYASGGLVQKFAIGGEAQSIADKLGFGKPLADSWWTGNFAGQDILFDWGSPTRAYKTSDGSKIDIDQNLRKPLRDRAQREWLAFVDQRTKERDATRPPLSEEQQAKVAEANQMLTTYAKQLAEKRKKQQAEDYIRRTENFTGDFEPTSVGSSTFRRGKTAQERRDYYAKRAQKYMAGGVAEESGISPNLQQLLDRIAAVGGPKTATELAGYPSGSMNIRKVLNKNSILAGKNISQAEAIVAKAEEAYKKKQAANRSAIDASNEFALVGAYPLGYSKDYGPENIGGLSTFFTARGLPSKYQQEIDEIAADIRDLPSRAAERIQMRNIFGAGTKLAFDLDDTLITDADIFKPGSSADPDIPAYSNVDRVTEALKNAKLTRLGEVLRSKLTETPQLLEDIRILTARPQNNAAAIATRLSQLGILISPDKITGVSGAGNKVDNLSEFETLIDDRLATIEQVTRAGKRAIPYEPIRGYDPTSPSAKKAAQVMEGYAIEGLMERLGVPIVEDDANRAIDYPNGLGAKASIWGVKPNVPTDVKRTMDGDAFGRFRAEIERYYSSNAQRFATGGSVQDTVPALLTPGEFVINKKAAATIGYGKLNKLNKADKLKGYNKGGIVGGIQSFADGGDVLNSREWVSALREISTVFQSTGSLIQAFNQVAANADAAGNTEVAERLREILNTTSGSDRTTLLTGGPGKNADIFMDEFDLGRVPQAFDALAVAIERNINVQELFASSAEAAGVSVQKFTKDVKSQILDKTLANVSGRQQSRASLRTEFARSRLLDFSDPAKVDRQREALKSSLGGLISDPTQLNKAVNDLITGAQNGSVSLQDIAASSAEVALALNSSIDRQEALNAATTELEDTLGGLTDAARATVDELESFEYGKSGQATKDFGFAGGINPEAALAFKNSSFGGRALGIAKDFQNTAFLDRLPVVGKYVGQLSGALSELEGPLGDAYRAVGGLPGAFAAVAVAAGELLPTILEKLEAGQSELGAGIGDALSSGGSRAIALGTLGNQLAGPIGGMIGAIGGAISGALEGLMTGMETQRLANSLNALAKTTEKVDKAFKYLADTNNENNLNNARAANDEIISAQRSLEYQSESSASEKLARASSGAVLGITAAGIALAALATIGVTVTGPLSAAALAIGGIGAAIYNAAGFTSGDNEAFSASLDAATKYVEGLATLAERKVQSFSLEDMSESLDNYRNFQDNLDQQVRVGAISQQDANARRQQYFADNAEGGPTLEEAQRSALRRRGYSIDDNQSVADFVAANPGAGTVANDAANAAARTLALDEINRTLGADTQAARAEITRLGTTGLERRGRELAGEQDIQLMQTQNLAIITRELNKETENLNQSYDRVLAAITRFNQQLDQLDLDLEYNVGMLTGDGRFGQVDRTQENMLRNMSAYTPEELNPVIQNVVNLAGGTPEAEKLGESIRANNIIENILPDILRRVENGDIEEVGTQLQDALQLGGISEDSAKALATEVKTALNNETTGNRQGVSFNELLKDFPAFQATLQSTQKAQEVGIAILEAQNNAYQKVNDNLNKFSDLLKKAEDYERKAADIRLQGALELRRTFGDLISLEDLNAPFNAQVTSLGGVGSTDPVAIAEGIRLNRTRAEQIRKELAAPGVGLDADKTKALNLELEELQRGSTNAYEALEKLANDGSNAANALSKIEENRQYGRNVIDFVRRISTQSGADAVEMNRSFAAFNRTLEGSLNFGNVRERRLAYEGMDTILPLIRNTAAGRQAEADFNINMLQGMGVRVDDPNAFGSGQTLRELIQSGTTGVDANTTALIEQYRKSIELQAIAATQLSDLNKEAAYLQVLPKIEIILLSLAQQLPSIIADAMLGNNITLPDDIVALNTEADAAEAESRRISTTQAALLQAINEWEVATLEGTPLRGDEAANITRLYDELGWRTRIPEGPYKSDNVVFPNAMQDIEQKRIAAMERAQTARQTATRATDDYTNEQRLQRDINRQDLFNPTTINAIAEANAVMAWQDATRAAEEARNRIAAAAAAIPINPAAPVAGAPPAGARVPPAALPAPAPAAAAAPAAVVNPAIFDRLAATLPQIDMQMLNVVNSMTVLSNGVIKLDATIALLQTELARDNGFSQSVTNFTETTRTFGGHVDTFTRKIDTFGTYVDKLDKAVGSLSNATITMGGSYTVDVRVSGAAAFTAIEDRTKDLINKEIDLAMGEMVARINRATGFNLDLNRRT